MAPVVSLLRQTLLLFFKAFNLPPYVDDSFSPFPSGAFAVCVWSTVQCPSIITAINPLHHHPSLTPLLWLGPVSSVLAAGTSFPGWCQKLRLPLCQYRACAEEQ